MHWTVGKVKITKVVELETVGSTRFILPLATNEEIQKLPWLIPHYANEEGRLKMSIHSLLMETPSRRIIVDTGLGNDKQGRNVPTWNNRKDPFLATLTAAGFPPDSIDTVLCTHLHVDHVGWNTIEENGRFVPTFPNARYLFSRQDFEFYDAENRANPERPAQHGAFNDGVLPVFEAGQAVMIDGEHAIDDNMLIRPAPGHTPGSVTLDVGSKGERGLFTGDILHHPLQVWHPEWNSRFCADPAMAATSRRKVLEHCVEHRALMMPAHFAHPHCGHVHRAGDSFRFAFAD